jgi:hypothetical protein
MSRRQEGRRTRLEAQFAQWRPVRSSAARKLQSDADELETISAVPSTSSSRPA